MSFHRYSPQKLLPDYLRGAAGLIICGGLVALAPNVTAVLVIFGSLALLFGVFMLQTAQKHFLVLELTEDRIGTPSNPSAAAWQDLQDVRLRYYALRRNKPGGWMTLRLGFPRQRISVDSNIEGFEAIVDRVAREVRERPVRVDDVSRSNLAALGHDSNAFAAAADQPAGSHP